MKKRTSVADYELLEELGSGNYGVYWRALTPGRLNLSAQHVALKVLHHRSGGQGYRRMVRELRVYRKADARYLVPIYDAGHDDGTIFYASEYSTTGSLANNLATMSKPQKLAALASVALGAHALHEVGLAHRDIKPQNMLLFTSGAKLSDLGVAQILNRGQTSTGPGPVSSLAFQAPESVRGETATRASDIFALGGSLHAALSGASIFPTLEGMPLKSALRFMLHPQASIHPQLTVNEADLVRECVSQDPNLRPATAAEFAGRVNRLAVEAEAA